MAGNSMIILNHALYSGSDEEYQVRQILTCLHPKEKQ